MPNSNEEIVSQFLNSAEEIAVLLRRVLEEKQPITGALNDQKIRRYLEAFAAYKNSGN
jgi:DNA-binding phage protein